MTNSHARWDSMRVDNQVWAYTFLSEGHVLLSVSHADRSFLAVSGRKLVSNLWDSNRPHLDFGEAIAILISCQDDLFYHTVLGMFQLDGAVLPRLIDIVRLGSSVCSELLTILEHILDIPDGRTFANDNVITVDNSTWIDYPVVV